MRNEPFGTVTGRKLPQRAKVAPLLKPETTTLLIVMGAPLRFWMPTAPASKMVPAWVLPRKMVLGDPFHGLGKKGFARRLSAYPTKTLTGPAAAGWLANKTTQKTAAALNRYLMGEPPGGQTE